jgi:hypothetical protein
MLNTMLRWTLVTAVMLSMSMFAAVPASAAEAMHMWKCEIGEDANEEDVEKHAKNWIKAAKQSKGGAGLKAYLLFPVAVNVVGQTDFMFVVVAPSFEDWGKFWDGYKTSPAAELEGGSKIACPHSAVWEKVTVAVD